MDSSDALSRSRYRERRLSKKYVLSNQCLSNTTVSFLITWRSFSSKSAAVYKISWKSDNFSLRYGDISIFKMAAVRHLGIVLPPYETTHEVSVCWPQLAVKFHVNLIQGPEDVAIWIFRIWFAMPIHAPKMSVLGDFGPINVIIHHQDPRKAQPCVNPRLLSYQL